MTRPDRPGRALIALGAALCTSCGGGGDDTAAVANLAPTVTLAAPMNPGDDAGLQPRKWQATRCPSLLSFSSGTTVLQTGN